MGGAPSGSSRVLVIDDDQMVRALVRVTLSAQGWEVLEASTTDQGIAKAIAERPDVVLLDVTFVGETRDGFAVCRELRSRRATERTPIVLFTAHDDPENRALASAVGATAFIAKPFGPLELHAMLRVVVAGGPEPSVGVFLIDAGIITAAQLERAVAEQRLRQGGPDSLGQALVELGYASTEDVRVAQARQQRAREAPRSAAGLADLRVVIADDNAAVRDALHAAIADEEGLSVVGLAIDGDDALRLVRTLTPDVLVLDNDMPKRRGIDVLHAARADAPDTRIVFFTLDEGIRDAALEAGAAAVVTKDQPLRVLIAEIRRAAASPSRAATNRGVVLAVRAARGASAALARTRQRIAVLGMLGVAYAGVFLVLEPFLGASASVLGLVPVGIAGALFGPEIGVLAALLSAALTAALWQGTGHLLGEPIFSVGGNGVGVLALIGIGAGFGVMRIMRGRVGATSRNAAAIAETAAALVTADAADVMGLLADAALESVRADAAFLYLTVPGGCVELVGATGAFARLVGAREQGEAVRRVLASRAAAVVAADRAMIGLEAPRMRSAIIAPLLTDSVNVVGVIITLSSAQTAYGPTEVSALATYGRFVGHVIAMRTLSTASAPSGAAVVESARR
ncbi:MAG TPA: response regulator [Candidatus Acidoferrales bacterium]|nr:response regulator [Candidatus Acidoferrales bacterium]